MMSPAEMLARLIAEPSDNNEHLAAYRDAVLDTNAKLAIDLGVRYGCITVALLAGLAETGGILESCDTEQCGLARARVRDIGLEPQWHFTVADDLAWGQDVPDSIDVLSIDTSHTYDQTLAELRLFAPKMVMGGVMLLHDTVAFRSGVWQAIQTYRIVSRDWIVEERQNNNGLAILRRVKP